MVELNNLDLDALKELGNIGAGHAATSLSKLLGRTISMSVPEIRVVRIPELSKIIDAEKIVSGTITAFKDPLCKGEGYLYVMFLGDTPKKLISVLCNSDDFGEYELSALLEVGNIISSSFCGAMADFLEVEIIPAPPSLAQDYALAVIDAVVSRLAESNDYVFLFEVMLRDEHDLLETYIVLIPDIAFFENVVKMLKRKVWSI